MTDTDVVVLDTLDREGVPLKAPEIARWNNLNPASVRRSLLRLATEGQVIVNDNGYWRRAEGTGSE